jgi:hypothetical protein
MSVFTAQWLAYAILLLQAIIFVFFLLILLIKAVEGFIRLFGGVHFDESTHPLDGGLFGAIADLDCLNPKGGKAAERKRRKRGSKQLQRNVSAVGSLTTQMMLDRHSLGVMRPTTTPYASEMGQNQNAPPSSFFPAYTPPLGPPPMGRRSSDDQPYGGGHIMDAWRPSPGSGTGPQHSQGGYHDPYQPATPGTYAQGRSQSSPLALAPPLDNPGGAFPNSGFAVIRGGRSDVENPYSVKPGTGAERSATISPPPTMRVSQVSPKPLHTRQQSSSAIIEDYDNRISPPISPLYPPSMRGSNNQNLNQALAPPVMAIPKRRSLNNLRDESTTPTKQDQEDRDAKKKKRRSWFKSGDLPSGQYDDYNDDDDQDQLSDDEPGPRRKSKDKGKGRQSIPMKLKEPAPFEPVPQVVDYDYEYDYESGPSTNRTRPTPAGSSRPGWRGMLGLGTRKKSLDDMAELARDENKARKAALAAESGAMLAGVQAPQEGRSFKVARRGPAPATIPTASSVLRTPIQSQAQSTSREEPKSFKVKRAKQPNTPTQVGMGNGYSNVPLVSPPAEVRSFKVNRSGQSQGKRPEPAEAPPSPSLSLKVNRPQARTSTPPQSPTLSQDPYASSSARGKASLFHASGR